MFGGDCGCAHTPMSGGAKKKPVPRLLKDRTKEQLIDRAKQVTSHPVSTLKKMTKSQLISLIK